MSSFSIAELKLLVSYESGPCVSIYMTIDQSNLGSQKATASLKHLLEQAEVQLAEMELPRSDIRAVLVPAHSLLDNADFWRQPNEGIALFLAPGFFRCFDNSSIAIEFSEKLTVAAHFEVNALLSLFTNNGQFYILVLKENHIALLQCTRGTSRGVYKQDILPHIHESRSEMVSVTEMQECPTGVGDHGEKPGAHDPYYQQEDHRLRSFRFVDSIIHKMLVDSPAPLILAGMDYQHAVYRQANTYPHLLDQGIELNLEHIRIDQLHQMAWEIVEPIFRQEYERACNRFLQSISDGQTSDQLAVILEAAYSGHIDTLFITEANRRFGKFDSKTLYLQESSEQYSGGIDLTDEAAAQTILNGGTVYVFSPDIDPDLPAVPAAILCQ